MNTQALSGIRVLEIAGGIAGAYAAKLFADMGADVTRLEPAHGDPLAARCLDADEPATEGLYWHYLNAGKSTAKPTGTYDLLILGEDSGPLPENLPAQRIARAAHQGGSRIFIQEIGLQHHGLPPHRAQLCDSILRTGK